MSATVDSEQSNAILDAITYRDWEFNLFMSDRDFAYDRVRLAIKSPIIESSRYLPREIVNSPQAFLHFIWLHIEQVEAQERMREFQISGKRIYGTSDPVSDFPDFAHPNGFS